MAGNAANLPVEEIHRFWHDVEHRLRTHYRLTGDHALRAILRYRDEIERVGPLVYHREASDIAQDIVAGGYAAGATRNRVVGERITGRVQY